MSQGQEGLVLTKDAEATINPHRLVKFGTGVKVALAATATDDVLGISDYLGVTYSAEVERNDVDVKVTRIADLELGGTVTIGAKGTSDASGRGIAAVATNKVYCMFLEAGVIGDVKKVLLIPGSTIF